MRVIRLIYEILDHEDRRGLMWLIPIMLLSSLADMVVVAAGAGFVTALTHPRGLLGSPVGGFVSSAFALESQATVLYVLGAATLAATILGNMMSVFSLRSVALFGAKAGGRLSARLLSNYLHQPYEFFLTRDPASLAARVLVEANGTVSGVLMAALAVSARLLGGVVIVAGLIWYDPGLSALLVAVMGCAYGLGYMLMRNYLRALGRRRLRLVQESHHITHESIEGVKEVQLYGIAEEEGARYAEVADELAYVKANVGVLTSSMRYLLELIGLASIVLVAVYYQWVGHDLAELTTILAAYGLATVRLLPVFQQAFVVVTKVQVQMPAMLGIHEDLASFRESRTTQLAVPPPLPFENGLELTDATYLYPSSETPVFAGLDLAIPAGSWVALVGTTGAGKSTLVDTLLGLLHLDGGRLAVDGVELDDLARKGWQRQIAYVPQHIFIRRATLRENISFAGEIPEDQIRNAIRIADLEAFVDRDLEQGLDSQLGPRGQRLSGGQRQRVGIARAIAQRPRFLVLDEATSALDNETEATVVKGLREELPGTTVVMIAHRLSSTRHCDRIFVLERGRILEQGSYDKLAAAGGRFATMLSAAE